MQKPATESNSTAFSRFYVDGFVRAVPSPCGQVSFKFIFLSFPGLKTLRIVFSICRVHNTASLIMASTDILRMLCRGTNIKLPRVHMDGSSVTPANGSPPTALIKEALPTINDIDECRAFLKSHKIKITKMSAMWKSRLKSKKEKKEQFRIYPMPITSFEQLQSRFGVHHSLAATVADQGYGLPTEVQMATWPLLFDTKSHPDILSVAPTGSGKTLAFMLPLIHHSLQSHRTGSQKDGREHYTTAIVLAPTKELVNQIVNEGRKLTAKTGVKISAVRKGMRLAGSGQNDHQATDKCDSSSRDKQDVDADLKEVKSDILVSTPLSLLSAISPHGEGSAMSLPHIKYLVLDEADVLFHERFRDQTLAAWKACLYPGLQVSLWSATMGSNIEELALSTIEDHRRTSSPPAREILRCVIGLKDSTVASISHRMIYAGTEAGKLLGLRNIIHPTPSPQDKKQEPLRLPFLVYTQTIERAAELYTELRYDIPFVAAAAGIDRIAVLHSDLSETKRADVMARFRNGQVWILITTDLLSRGIDFRGVNGVVNYDMPTTAASYVHRAGRTNRAGRQGGIAVTIWTNEDVKYLKGHPYDHRDEPESKWRRTRRRTKTATRYAAECQ